MFYININHIEKFKKINGKFRYYINNGMYLLFKEDLSYQSLETYYNISCKNYSKIENDTLSKLYSLGWIVYE